MIRRVYLHRFVNIRAVSNLGPTGSKQPPRQPLDPLHSQGKTTPGGSSVPNTGKEEASPMQDKTVTQKQKMRQQKQQKQQTEKFSTEDRDW